MTSTDPNTDALLAGADVEVPADAPASGVRETDLPPPATDADADAENDDVSVNPTSP
ncbi:MAG: hypothetical protein M3Q22_10050 [Actinomycetota bacterium]|nr:hypothetical protein [Actinomycetota bacterium]